MKNHKSIKQRDDLYKLVIKLQKATEDVFDYVMENVNWPEESETITHINTIEQRKYDVWKGFTEYALFMDKVIECAACEDLRKNGHKTVCPLHRKIAKDLIKQYKPASVPDPLDELDTFGGKGVKAIIDNLSEAEAKDE